MPKTLSTTAAAVPSAPFVTIGNVTSLTGERALTGTANQVIVTDNGANSTAVLSTPQNIDTGASPTFVKMTLTGTGTGAGIIGYDSSNLSISIGDGTTAQDIDIGTWRTFSSTLGGFSGTPSQTVRYQKVGRGIYIAVSISGTSNATTFTFTLPIATSSSSGAIDYVFSVTDNGTLGGPGRVALASNSATVNVFRNGGSLGWTGSGTKGINCAFFYET